MLTGRVCLSMTTGSWRLSITLTVCTGEDLDVADLEAIRHAGLRLGLSTHDDREIDRALAFQPSYIALGHIFPTQTKAMPSAPQDWSS